MTDAPSPAEPGRSADSGPIERSPAKSDDSPAPLSASRLKCFQTCRLQYYFRYVERIPKPTAPALLVGQVVHAVLQTWNLTRWRGEDASVERMRLAFEAHWVDRTERGPISWKDPDDEPGQRARAWKLVEHYLAHSPVPLEERPEAVEVVVERDLPARGLPPLKGVIDLVRDGGRIVDFKTTARTPDDTQARHLNEVQLGCYALLYREATGREESGFELHHLVKTRKPGLVVTGMEPMRRGQIDRLLRVMESHVAGVAAGDFVPSPGLHCGFCDYFAECRRWSGERAPGHRPRTHPRPAPSRGGGRT